MSGGAGREPLSQTLPGSSRTAPNRPVSVKVSCQRDARVSCNLVLSVGKIECWIERYRFSGNELAQADPGSQVDNEIRHPCFHSEWPEPETTPKKAQKKLCLRLGSCTVFLNSNLDNSYATREIFSLTSNNTSPAFDPEFNPFCYQVNKKKEKESELINISALCFLLYYLAKQSGG